jgi:Concanavalin A-like lectin/glucanases superfamily/Secretion system C-terminal sorting domain
LISLAQQRWHAILQHISQMMNMSKRCMQQIWIVLCLLAAGSSFAQVPSYLPTNGLVACYTLNGSTTDVSGNGNDGTPSSITPTTDRFLHPGSAGYFSGQTVVDCGNASSLDVDDCTIAAWVRLSNTVILQQTIVAKSDSVGDGSFVMTIAEDRFRTFFYADSFQLQLDCYAPIINPSNWYHLVATHSVAFGVNMYINGVLVKSSPVAEHLRQGGGSHHLRLGAWGAALVDPMQAAKLDDVAIWNRAIGTEEIEGMYQAGLVAIDGALPETGFSVFPNPASDKMKLVADDNLVGEKWLISNALGQEMQGGIVSERSAFIQLNHMAPGMYFIQVGTERPSQKLMVR